MLNLIYLAAASSAAVSLSPMPIVGDTTIVPRTFTTISSWESSTAHSAWPFEPETSTVENAYYSDAFDATKITIEYTKAAGDFAVFSLDKDVTLTAESATAQDATLADLDIFSYVVPTTYAGSGSYTEAWPSILYQVPTDASPGDVFYGSIKVDDVAGDGVTAIVRYALVKVTVNPVIIPEQDIDQYMAMLENDGANYDLYNINPDHRDPNSVVGGKWQSVNEFFGANSKTDLEIRAQVDTVYLFNVYYGDSEMDIAPVVQDPAFTATQYAFEDREVTGEDSGPRRQHGLKLQGDDLEGKSFYVTVKHVMGSTGTQYLRIKLTIERPSRFMVQAAWENDITVGTYGNNMIINIERENQLLKKNDKFEVVAEVSLAAGGLLGLSILNSPGSQTFTPMVLKADDSLEDKASAGWQYEDEVVLTEYSHLLTNSRIGAAYKVPDDAAIGDVFYLGVNDDFFSQYTGTFKITVTAHSEPYETSAEFDAALPADTQKKSYTTMDDFADSLIEAYKFSPTESLDLYAGQTFAVQINILGVTATIRDPFTTVDQFDSLVNLDGKALIARSSVAKRDPAIYEYPLIEPADNSKDLDPADSTVVDETTTDETATDETTTEEETATDETETRASAAPVGDETSTDTTTEDATTDETATDETTTDDSTDTTTTDGGEETSTTEESTDTTTEDATTDETTTDETTTDETAEEPEVVEPEVPVVWSPLVKEANRDVYPSFAWTVPANAAVGDRFWLQVDVAKGTSEDLEQDNYYGVFLVTVTESPPAIPEEPEPEAGWSLLTTLVAVTAVTAAGVACLYFFVI